MSQKEIKLSIEGMSCGHCVGRIEKALNSEEGVISAKVDLSKEEGAIKYDATTLTEDEIDQIIEDTGYKVKR